MREEKYKFSEISLNAKSKKTQIIDKGNCII